MCFQLGSTHSVQTVHGANDGKYSKVVKPGVELGLGNKASAAKNSNAKQPAIEIDSTVDETSSDEESEGGSDDLSSSDKTSTSASSEEDEQSHGPAGRGQSALDTPPPPRGGQCR